MMNFSPFSKLQEEQKKTSRKKSQNLIHIKFQKYWSFEWITLTYHISGGWKTQPWMEYLRRETIPPRDEILSPISVVESTAYTFTPFDSA